MKVRLSEYEIKVIKNLIREIFGDSEIYIFGSRTNLNKKGGDIDIFIIPKQKSNLYRKKVKLVSKLEFILEKPVDILISKDKNREIERNILKEGVKLV